MKCRSGTEFWDELTNKKLEGTIPPKNVPQPEDTLLTMENGGSIDDSDVPVQSVISKIIHKRLPKGYTMLPDGGIGANAEAERFSDVDEAVNNDKLGCGKRKRKPNIRYSTSAFWRHGDSDDEGTSG